MPPTRPPLSDILPSLICGTATFNSQYNTDPFALPTALIIESALRLGLRAFDTSPYYGPSESLLGAALSTQYVQQNHPRESYHLVTKVGRIGGSEFDYSPEWVRHSIKRSLQRLHTEYLDVVYCHDVEFVTPEEVLEAISELRRIRDTQGTIKYIGISGYPVSTLCALSELILRETGEPLDAVMSYANYTVQNTTLQTEGVARLKAAGVSVVPNASPLGMGLLRSAGVPVGGKGDFHPAPRELRQKVMEAAEFIESTGEKLEVVSIRWALENWAREGASLGGVGGIGVSVMGVSNLSELEETMRVWNSVLDGLDIQGRKVEGRTKEWSVERSRDVEAKVKGIWEVLGKWRDFAWASPDEGYVNTRAIKETMDDLAAKPDEQVAANGDMSKLSRI